jgi:hypothetical protein
MPATTLSLSELIAAVWISAACVGVPATVSKTSDFHQSRLSGPLNGNVTPA